MGLRPAIIPAMAIVECCGFSDTEASIVTWIRHGHGLCHGHGHSHGWGHGKCQDQSCKAGKDRRDEAGDSVTSGTSNREERLAQALRANLHRRKAQSRARRGSDAEKTGHAALSQTADLADSKQQDKAASERGLGSGTEGHENG